MDDERRASDTLYFKYRRRDSSLRYLIFDTNNILSKIAREKVCKIVSEFACVKCMRVTRHVIFE